MNHKVVTGIPPRRLERSRGGRGSRGGQERGGRGSSLGEGAEGQVW